MDIGCDAAELTGSTDPITVWDAARLAKQRQHRHFAHLCEVIDTMGMLSKESQGINVPLTSVNRLRDNPCNRLYLLCAGPKCLGIIKTGNKKLFIRSRSSALIEMDPLCVLDFFVHPSEQRSGYGKVIYDFMLGAEGVTPDRLGIDRPSPKFLSFMRKHFGLQDFVPQTNNFVVFSQYFETQGGRGRAEAKAQPPAAEPAREAVFNRAPGSSPPLTSTRAPLAQHGTNTRDAAPLGKGHSPPTSRQAPPPAPTPPLSDVQVRQATFGGGGPRPLANTATTSMAIRSAPTLCRAPRQPTPGAATTATLGLGLLPVARGPAPLQPSTLLASQQLAASTGGRRTSSPTRSGVAYNILTPNFSGMPAPVVQGGAARRGRY